MGEHNERLQEDESQSGDQQGHGGANLLLELAPLVLFLVFYKLYDIQIGTIALVVATLVSLGINWVLYKKLSPMPVVAAVVVTIFGGLTVYLDDDSFIKMKPTIVYVLFAFALIVMRFIGRSALKTLLGAQLNLPSNVWKQLETAWILFFIVLAGANEFVWRNFDTDFWVYFKFALFPITLIFSFTTILFGMQRAERVGSEDS